MERFKFMNVVKYKEIDKYYKMGDIYMKKLSFSNMQVAELLGECFKRDMTELVSILNTINNQGIENIQLPVGYIRRGKFFRY